MNAEQVLMLLSKLPIGSSLTLSNTGSNYSGTFRIAGINGQRGAFARGQGIDPVSCLEEAYTKAIEMNP